MKPTTLLVILAALLVPGCDRDSAVTEAVTEANGQPRQPPLDDLSTRAGSVLAEEPRVEPWQPSFLEGGYMFRDVQQFAAYIRQAPIVAIGILTEWDGSKGVVHVDAFLRGKRDGRSVPVVATGGIVRPSAGQKVIFLLAPRDGQMKLHSFCGASGLYSYSEDLARAMEDALKPAE